MPRPRASACWGIGLTVLVHLLLAMSFLRQGQHPKRHSNAPGRTLEVQLMAQPAAPPEREGPRQELAPRPPAPLEPPAAPVRAELRYYFPEELDRQLIVLRDPSIDADITVKEAVVMHLFVDVEGKVAAISFEGEPAAAARDTLRALFMRLEFLPGMKDGKAVPARIKIGISAHAPSGADSEAPAGGGTAPPHLT